MNADLAKPIHGDLVYVEMSLTGINDLLQCGFPRAFCRDDG
jgi:hypothetical protein